jgi:YjbE family integral membrane protein
MIDWLQQNIFAIINVIIIDVVMAGDNAIIVGLAASRVREELRSKVILWGIVGAVLLRIAFAAVATQLLAIVGLTLAGGLLLLWVCWKMYWELTGKSRKAAHTSNVADTVRSPAKPMSFSAAVTQIIAADLSMSLDNVLAVAGVAKGSAGVLVIGLAVAIVLMAVAANFIADLLARYPWISWIGLAIIFYVAVDMIWDGSREIVCRGVSSVWCTRDLWSLLTGWFM